MHPNTADRIRQRLPEVASLLRRISLELAFAAKLTERELPALAPTVIASAAKLDQFQGSAQEFTDLVAQIEQELSGAGDLAKTYVIHCVGHGHIDMNWMWSWPETVATTYDTFASVLALMDQYPTFTYSQSQASVYALIERYYPEMFARIQARVREGRWEVAAAHWVEGDKNLASGESLARHLLYTREYFAEKFGLTPEDVPIDWEPDTFGHANTIPAILTQGGVRFYYSCRQGGGWDHERIGVPRPRMFWWEAPNGARILVNRESTWYNSYVNIGDNFADPMLDFTRETGLHHWMNVFGVGNHGGGPTRTEIDYFIETQSWPIWPRVAFSTSKRFFETAEAELNERKLNLPVLSHELNFEFTGCYTSQSAIKRANRLGENYAVEAEGLLAVTKNREPQPRLRQAWLSVLFNQFHDILPGSGIAATREHALALFQEVGAITGAIKRNAGETITRDLDTLSLLPNSPEADQERALNQAANTPYVAGAGQKAGSTGHSQGSSGGRRFRPFLIYNPLAWTRSEWVTVDLYDMDLEPSRIVARDERGRETGTVFLGRGHDWGHDKLTVTFLAEVPAHGYRTYLLGEGKADSAPLVRAIGNHEFANAHLHYRWNRYGSGPDLRLSDGTVMSAVGDWHQTHEIPRGMTSWILGAESGESLPAVGYHTHGFPRNEGTSLPLGDARLIRVHQDLKVPQTESRVRLTAQIRPDRPRFDVRAEIDWREIGDDQRGIPGLRIDFPCAGGDIRYETPFGVVSRPADLVSEVPTLRFVNVPQGGGRSITVVQDSKYGFRQIQGTVSMRVLRSSFDPDHAPEVGKSILNYAVIAHESPVSDAELIRLGAELNHPLIVFPALLQAGPKSPAREFARVDGDLILSCLKPGYESGTIVRVFNPSAHAASAEIHLDSVIFQGIASVVDLLEQPSEVEGSSVEIRPSGLRLTLPAFTTISLRL